MRMDDVQRTADLHGVEPVWFPGMGHDVMLDSGWERVLETVLRFVDELPAWGATGQRAAGRVTPEG